MFLALMLISSAPVENKECGPPPRGQKAWIKSSDYPQAALRANMRGLVHFELDVSGGGCPIACRVTKSSGYTILDNKTCVLMLKRARFNPNADGQPFTWKNKFIWSP